MDSIFTGIRCPLPRKHVKYDNCGRLLLAIKDGKIFPYCEMCKTFFELTILDNDNVEMRPLNKKERLKLKTNLRVII